MPSAESGKNMFPAAEQKQRHLHDKFKSAQVVVASKRVEAMGRTSRSGKLTEQPQFIVCVGLTDLQTILITLSDFLHNFQRNVYKKKLV